MKLLKALAALENKKATSNLKLKDYICFLIKSLEDALRKIPDQELRKMIVSLKNEIFEAICLAAESDEILVRN